MTPNCEGGKIDETFQALTQLAQTEGCSKGAAARHDAVAPFGLFLKFNPNACDVGRFTLRQRIDVLVRRCNAFLSQPASFFIEGHSGREEAPSGGDDVLPLQPREQCCHSRTAGAEQREPHPLAGKHVLCLNEAGQRK